MALELTEFIKDGSLAPQLANEVFTRVTESSVVGKVAGTGQFDLVGTQYMIDAGKIEADIVGEGEAKPVSSYKPSFVRAVPLKAAVIITWTKEMRAKNPGNIMDRIQEKLTEAIQEQIDAAVIYGKTVKSDSQIEGVTYLNQTEKRVELGNVAANAGGLATEMIAGYNQVTAAGEDFTGFIADPLLRGKLISAVDVQGRPVYQSSIDLKDQMGTLYGLPMAYGKSVSGRYGVGKADTKVRAFGGDFKKNLKLGFLENINIKLTDSATVDGVSLWQTNQEAALCEAIFGYVIKDPNAFVAYEDAV
ncbi:MAG: phage major capsid protein [Rothia sp. (in: high G+C Gram-positive bacteria)]|uniref:phage major capsid protein n=1 Tax=Rothia sp. (in: high G+C Gram-positive bacteria) TaxID=1885016 RepID=UPI0026F4B406|nr:phage major capsid protein [Rothia sp. (in: high G+C Gram-positive bacteria)]